MKSKPLLAALAAFVVLAAVSGFVCHKEYVRLLSEERQRAYAIADGSRDQLESTLQHALAASQALAILVREMGVPKDFDHLASAIVKAFPGVDSVQLAPKGVVRYVYPLKGNERAVGHDLLHDPERRAEALAAIARREIVFAGPFELRQGGWAVVGRMPVIREREGQEQFWGFSIVVIRIASLLGAAQTDHLTQQGYVYRLSRDDSSPRVLHQSGALAESPLNLRVKVPNGEWNLSVAPVNGWNARIRIVPLCAMALFLSVLGASFTYFMVRKPEELSLLVEERSAEVRQSEARFRALFNQAAVGIAQVGLDGRWLLVNDRVCEMLGYERRELLALSFQNVTYPEDLEADLSQVAALLAGEGSSYVIEKRYVRKDGSLLWGNLTVVLVRGSGGAPEYFIAVIEDISAQKVAEGELEKRVMEVNLALSASGMGVWNWDIITGRMTTMRGRGPISGLPPHLYPYSFEAFMALLHEEDRPVVAQRVESALKGEAAYEAEFRIVLPAGDTRWVNARGEVFRDEAGRPLSITGVDMDVTGRKQAERELMVTNEELLVINRIVSAVAGVLTRDAVLDTVLDEALKITGLEGGTICLVGADDTLLLAAQREASEAVIRDLSTNTIRVGDCLCGKCAQTRKPLILPDRQAVTDYSSREALRGEDIRFHAAFPLVAAEKCLGVLCVFTRTDYKPAERRVKLLETVSSQLALAIRGAQLYEETLQHAALLEEKVKERTAELEQANVKLREMDQMKSMFIASMSHELRTPLNSIIGFSSILLKGWAGPINDEQRDNLASMLRSGKHLLNLVNDVIDVSKIAAGRLDINPEEFDLREVIEEAAGSLANDALAKGLDFTLHVHSCPMFTDRQRLLQCVLNLLSNAMKYTDHGSVTVTTKHQLVADAAVSATIIVEDTGIGIREEDMPKLFSSFTRFDSPLRNSVSGTGLGLYLTKSIVGDVLKGDISAESRYGKGSRFVIRIPCRVSTV